MIITYEEVKFEVKSLWKMHFLKWRHRRQGKIYSSSTLCIIIYGTPSASVKVNVLWVWAMQCAWNRVPFQRTNEQLNQATTTTFTSEALWAPLWPFLTFFTIWSKNNSFNHVLMIRFFAPSLRICSSRMNLLNELLCIEESLKLKKCHWP